MPLDWRTCDLSCCRSRLAKHDDIVDALGLIGQLLDTISIGNKPVKTGVTFRRLLAHACSLCAFSVAAHRETHCLSGKRGAQVIQLSELRDRLDRPLGWNFDQESLDQSERSCVRAESFCPTARHRQNDFNLFAYNWAERIREQNNRHRELIGMTKQRVEFPIHAAIGKNDKNIALTQPVQAVGEQKSRMGQACGLTPKTPELDDKIIGKSARGAKTKHE